MYRKCIKYHDHIYYNNFKKIKTSDLTYVYIILKINCTSQFMQDKCQSDTLDWHQDTFTVIFLHIERLYSVCTFVLGTCLTISSFN